MFPWALSYHIFVVTAFVSVHVVCFSNTYYNASGPRVEQKKGTDEKGAGEHHTDGQQKPVA